MQEAGRCSSGKIASLSLACPYWKVEARKAKEEAERTGGGSEEWRTKTKETRDEKKKEMD